MKDQIPWLRVFVEGVVIAPFVRPDTRTSSHIRRVPARQPEFLGSHLGVREARRASEINVSDPPKLDEETLARIRSIHRDYFERWTLFPVGGTLDLRF